MTTIPPTSPAIDDALRVRGVAHAGSVHAAVLLAGAVRESPLARGARRALLDLPLTPALSIAGEWVRRIGELRSSLGVRTLPLFVATTPSSADTQGMQPGPCEGVTVVPDSGPLRGTGGALVDLCERFEADDVLLIANAHAVALRPLSDVVSALLAPGADVVLHADEHAAPTGVILARVRALREIPRRGFVDFKEQALSRIARRYSVRVIAQPGPHVAPVRTLDGYIRAVRFFNAPPGAVTERSPLAEDWQSTFGLVEAEAHTASDARVLDSVVLAGARVDPGAVIVRSVVCRGAHIAAGGFVCDQVVGEGGEIV